MCPASWHYFTGETVRVSMFSSYLLWRHVCTSNGLGFNFGCWWLVGRVKPLCTHSQHFLFHVCAFILVYVLTFAVLSVFRTLFSACCCFHSCFVLCPRATVCRRLILHYSQRNAVKMALLFHNIKLAPASSRLPHPLPFCTFLLKVCVVCQQTIIFLCFPLLCFHSNSSTARP